MIRHVAQKRPADCGVAAIAMLAGISYSQALRTLAKAAREKVLADVGINAYEVEAALRKHGFVAFLLIQPHYGGGTHERRVWPPEPVGWRHLISSQNASGDYHFSVMDEDGRVFDPAWPDLRSLSEYHRVVEVIVMVRPTKWVKTPDGPVFVERVVGPDWRPGPG